MSIIVENITKLYGSQKALDNVSFKIRAGEIVGLLGPNGAGKSTLMKIISCFIPPTEGTISVSGHNIFDQSIEVRKNVGYLPENNPLYLDLYIKEYLEFVAGLYSIPSKKNRVKEMIAMTGLEREQNKKIGALSKGYRQRVGLAQALIHDPKILILDEPTSGLDPNQLLEIRELIKNVGKDKTVMLSTHIMQEVEAICSRAIIIDQGKIVADDSTENLSESSSDLQIIEVEFDSNIEEKHLLSIQGIKQASKQNSKQWILHANTKEDIRPLIFEFAVNNNLKVLSMQKSSQSLEKVFQKLTMKKITE